MKNKDRYNTPDSQTREFSKFCGLCNGIGCQKSCELSPFRHTRMCQFAWLDEECKDTGILPRGGEHSGANANDIDRVICEMEYLDTVRYEWSKVIALGAYKGFQYCVINVRGDHPCGYVNISGHEEQLRDEKCVTEYDMDKFWWIECHGGITWANSYVADFAGGFLIGWDYAQFGDFSPLYKEGKVHAVNEVVMECKNVIDQILERIIGFQDERLTQ